MKATSPAIRALHLALLILVLTAPSCAGPGATDDPATSGESQAGEEAAFDAHRQFVRLHFDDDEMDFAFQWVLGSISMGGCELGEAFTAAGKITSGDAESWQREWAAMGTLVEARGRASLEAGHEVSAREQLMRASNYYRASLISMDPDSPSFEANALKARELLEQAGRLLDPPLEYIELAFEDTMLPGYYRRAGGSGPKKTLIMIGGGETFAEDLVFYIARAAHERGYNFLTVDLPGQGLMPLAGKPFRAEMEGPLRVVVDFALSRPEVDPERLAMYGISGGGYFVPRAAVTDKRIKAIAMNSAVVDDQALFASMPVATATPDVVATWSSFKRGTVEAIAWRWDVPRDDIPGLVAAQEGYQFDPTQVTCPALVLVGEGEYQDPEVQRQQQVAIDNLPNPDKRFIITPGEEGASSHCIGENRSVMSQVVFDFFDEIFAAAQ